MQTQPRLSERKFVCTPLSSPRRQLVQLPSSLTLRYHASAGRLKEQCGLPFSAVLQPYARLGDKEAAPNDAGVRSDAVARCSSCYSWVPANTARTPNP